MNIVMENNFSLRLFIIFFILVSFTCSSEANLIKNHLNDSWNKPICTKFLGLKYSEGSYESIVLHKNSKDIIDSVFDVIKETTSGFVLFRSFMVLSYYTVNPEQIPAPTREAPPPAQCRYRPGSGPTGARNRRECRS